MPVPRSKAYPSHHNLPHNQGSITGSDKAAEEEGEDLEDEEEYDEEEEEDEDRPRKKPRHGGFILDEAGSKTPSPTYISYITNLTYLTFFAYLKRICIKMYLCLTRC